jgi:hypothetical protein
LQRHRERRGISSCGAFYCGVAQLPHWTSGSHIGSCGATLLGVASWHAAPCPMAWHNHLN